MVIWGPLPAWLHGEGCGKPGATQAPSKSHTPQPGLWVALWGLSELARWNVGRAGSAPGPRVSGEQLNRGGFLLAVQSQGRMALSLLARSPQ